PARPGSARAAGMRGASAPAPGALRAAGGRGAKVPRSGGAPPRTGASRPTQALDHDRGRLLVEPLRLRGVRAQQLRKAEVRRELDILDSAASLAVLAHQLPPPARGAGHRDTHGCTSRYRSALA